MIAKFFAFVLGGVFGKVLFALLGANLMVPRWNKAIKEKDFLFFTVQGARVLVTAIALFIFIDVNNMELSKSNLFVVFAPFFAIILFVDAFFYFTNEKNEAQKNSRRRYQWEDEVQEEKKPTGFGLKYSLVSAIAAIILFVSWLWMIIIYPNTVMDELHKTVKVDVKAGLEEVRDIDSMIIVTKGLADEKNDAVNKDIPNTNFYTEGEITLTKYQDKLVYSSPIEFDGFKKVGKAKVSPGFTVVSALDPSAGAEILKSPLKYTDSNYFEDNIVRIVREAYPDKKIFGHYLQPISEAESQYVFTIGTKKMFRSGDKVEGIVTVHPNTKEMKFYSLDKLPKWINRAFTEENAMDMWTIWGTYEKGWWNQSAFGPQVDTIIPTDDNLQEIVDDKTGDILYVTDFVKAKNSSSKSLVGYGTFNARTGEMIYYSYEEPVLTGTEAKNKINGDEQLRFKGSVPFTTFFTIYGQPTYVGPVIDKSNKFVGIAVLYGNSNNPQLAFGKNKDEAFRNYKRIVASLGKGNDSSPSQKVVLQSVEGIVTKINDANLESGYTFVIRIEGSEKAFLVNPNTFIDVVTTEKGEKVKMQVLDMEDKVIPVEKFEVLTVVK